ncbi:hypothetical protein ACO0LD_11975 [Undibacterium sp. Ji83W]|uniref:hypothetical protein n=1 Tax=Undibacterium sp. Ji83W TaxID=3413043 RepID=UPI003BF2B7A6
MKKFLPIALAAALLAGCATPYSETPLAGNFPTTTQNKLQAASHWLVIAKDVAEQIKLGTDKIGAPVYIMPPEKDSQFTQAFYNQIITSLVNQGVVVRKINDSTTQVVNIETQLVRFSPDRHQNKRFTSVTAIGVGIAAVHGLGIPVRTDAVLGGLALAGAYDWTNWVNQEYAKGRTPMHELIVTTSLVKNSQYIARRTDAYYVADWDWTLYNKDTDFNFRVVGGQ